jgi:hypothetical protein
VMNNNAVLSSKETDNYVEALWGFHHGCWPQLENMSEGETASRNVKIECLLNRPAPRAPRRPHEVIVEEKVAKAAAKAERAAERARWGEKHKKAVEEQQARSRRRIKNQIDYAFKSGPESGSEPVAKYITCGNCDAPAEFLRLSREVPPGAAVLDESLITGATCAEHNNPGYCAITQAAIPCSRLEFFYNGIRQIGIKP